MSERERVILHCDCNGFFASVELLTHPELREVPMAVTGDPENRHGIILAKNEIAKRYGVKTAETIHSARMKCPDLVCVLPHHDEYHRISKVLNRLYLEYTDLVDPFSVDESFLDVTGSLKLFGMTPKELADTIRERVKREVGITVSVGVSFCRVFAKLGSDYQKPDATTVIDRTNYREIAWPLPVSDLIFAGKKTTETLSRIGIRTIGDLANADERVISDLLGESGVQLRHYARGEDPSPVRSYYDREEPKSIGNGMTFRRDIVGEEEIRAGVSALCDSVSSRLRAEKKKCLVVQVQVKDPNFRTTQKQCTLPHSTWLCQELTSIAFDLIRKSYGISRPIRALTVTAASLVPADEVHEQLTIFGDSSSDPKQEAIEDAVAGIRSRFGKGSIRLGAYGAKGIGIDCYEKSPAPKRGDTVDRPRDPKRDNEKK